MAITRILMTTTIVLVIMLITVLFSATQINEIQMGTLKVTLVIQMMITMALATTKKSWMALTR